jgi:serine/threonine protein kinase/predicted Zn-dependent protease
MTDAEVRRNPVEELAEEFLQRFRRGERPALTEYTRRCPELADVIRDLFPALVLLEQAGPSRLESSDDGGGVPADGGAPERLGDYHILREVGRGGMGVVYEAVQESLGRHVALKVLPGRAASDPGRLQRFKREARSAARLHHTNIVPVFEVGEQGGVHYYAMQFIQGQSLDGVLDELRRQRADDPTKVSPPNSQTASLAVSLLTGRFQALAEEVERAGDGCPTDSPPAGPATQAMQHAAVPAGDGPSPAGPPCPTPVPAPERSEPSAGSDSPFPRSAARAGLPAAEAPAPADSACPTPAPARSELSAASDFPYYRSVARVGLQVAEALAYAHGQQVLHRDIKPANLLLDLQGTVWVTDFGLAREEGSDLTQTGELVGTLRYMAPERFRGATDARSDLYALGMTLYELLTLRPAFPETDQLQLYKQIQDQEPVRPRRFDPRIPRDLETIVLKAIAKEPGRRYPSAEELAEDLRRFLADRPVRARRTSPWEHAWRWCRRNPAVASLTALVVGLVVAVAASLGWAARDREARDAALDEQVGRTLDGAGALSEEGKWPEALAEVERADKLLSAAGRVERPLRLLELRKDLSFAERLEEIYRGPSRNQKANVGNVRAELNQKAGVILGGGEQTGRSSQIQADSAEQDFFWGRAQDARFAKEFREFGIDLDRLAPAEAAAHIARTSIRPAFVQALDEWAAMRRRARGDKDAFWKKLLEIAGQADPDDWRNQFRQALLRRDRPALEKLAAEVPIRTVPPATAYLLGHALKELGALDQAMAVLREAHRHHPDDFWLNDALGWFSKDALNPPRYDDASRYYMAALALRPQNVPTRCAVAEALAGAGAFPEAIAQFSRALELKPDFRQALRGRGDAYLKLGQRDKGIADFSRLIDLDPNSAQAWWQRGHIYLEIGEWHKAIADYSKVIELDRKSRFGWYSRGLAYLFLREWHKAVADFSEDIKLYPNNPGALFHRAEAQARLGQWEKAVADYSKAIELFPNPPAGTVYREAWALRGGVYCALGQWGKAAADYAEQLKLDPGNEWYLYQSAVLRLQIGDREGYRRACREMLDRFGNTDKPAVAEQTAKTCSLAPDAVSPFEPVSKLADRAVKVREPDRWLLLAKALAEYRADHSAETVEWLKRVAPKVDGEHLDATAFAVLALARHRLGRVREARAALASAQVILAQKMPDPGKGRYFGGDWHDWLRAQILVHEAEKLFDEDDLKPTKRG